MSLSSGAIAAIVVFIVLFFVGIFGYIWYKRQNPRYQTAIRIREDLDRLAHMHPNDLTDEDIGVFRSSETTVKQKMNQNHEKIYGQYMTENTNFHPNAEGAYQYLDQKDIDNYLTILQNQKNMEPIQTNIDSDKKGNSFGDVEEKSVTTMSGKLNQPNGRAVTRNFQVHFFPQTEKDTRYELPHESIQYNT